jgi:hypothetical protein
MSSYDDWKTTEPAYLQEGRLCLHCKQPIELDDEVVDDMHHDCWVDCERDREGDIDQREIDFAREEDEWPLA